LGRITQYTYNTLDEVTAEKWYDGATLVRTIGFTYNDAGELTQATDPAATYGYNYDNDGRVKYESQSFAGFSPLIEYNRGFDADSSVLSLAAILAGTADFKNLYDY
jgi:YD repeat-containing protein